MNRTTETQIELLRSEYWALFEELKEGDVSADVCEALVSILDSLGGLVRLELEQGQSVAEEDSSKAEGVRPMS